jgi:hypothetical protein
VTSSVSLGTSANPSTVASAITITATINPATATGDVAFFVDGSVLGFAPVASGTASLSVKGLATGPRKLSARYSGDGSTVGNWSPVVTQTVTALPSNVFAAVTPLAAGAQPIAIAAGDLNRDGNTDVVVVNANGNSVSVSMGQGDGAFLGQEAFPVGTQPSGIAISDFNRDGHLDLAVTNYADSSVSILRGRGDGTFQNAVTTAVGSNALAAIAIDLNRDGKSDLAVATFIDVKVLIGNGDGTFQPPVAYTAGSSPFALVSGDFNEDGNPDVAAANSNSGTASVLLGNGDGTLRAAVQCVTGSNPRSIVAGDWNQDGHSDLAVANFGGNNISVLRGNGNGTFQAATNYADGSGPTALAAADFTGDGIQDLIVANYAGTLSVMPGNAGGTFGTPVSIPAGASPTGVVVADFNNDSRLDAAVATGGATSTPILIGHNAAFSLSGTPQTTSPGTQFSSPLAATLVASGTGTPIPGVTVTFWPPASGATASLSATNAVTNSSGVVSVTATANRTVGVYEVGISAGLLGGNFFLANALGNPATITPSNTPQRTLTGSAFPKPLQVTVADVGGNPLSGVTVIFGAPGTGASATFSSSTAVTNAEGVASVTATANGTAGSYIVSASASGLTASFALTNQAATILGLSTSTTSTTLGNSVTLTASLTPAGATGKVTFFDGITFLGTKSVIAGAASLSTTMLPAGARKLKAYYSGDSTYAAATSSTVTVAVGAVSANFLLNLPAGSGVSVGSSTSALAVADFNSDGRADLAVTSPNSSKVSVAVGNGNGTFQTPTAIGVANIPRGIVAADLNNDGRTDLVVTNYVGGSSGAISVLLGNGDGTMPMPAGTRSWRRISTETEMLTWRLPAPTAAA